MSRSAIALTLAMLLGAAARADDVNVSPTFVDFGRVKIGTTATVRVVFDNLTAGQLQVAGGGGLPAPFSGNVGTCNGGIVPASSSCYFEYSFRPADNDDALLEAETGVAVTGDPRPSTRWRSASAAAAPATWPTSRSRPSTSAPGSSASRPPSGSGS